MKKIASLFLALVILALTACSPAATVPAATTMPTDTGSNGTAPAEADKVYIGVIAPLTGNEQSKGKESRQGVELAIEQFNANGGILGRQVEAVFFDRIDTTEGVVNAAKMALEDKRLSCILTQCSSQQVLSISPYIKAAGMPLIISGNAAAVQNEGNPYIWFVRNLNKYVATAMVDFAVEQLDTKKPAIWFQSLDMFVEYKNNAVKEYQRLGIDIPDTMIFSTTDKETNFMPVAAEIEKSGCDSLLVFGSALHLSYLAKSLHDAGVNIPAIVGDAQVSAKECVENAGNTINGWYCIADFASDDTREIVTSFNQSFQEKYGSRPNVESAYAYDECLVIKAAMEAAGSTTDRELINAGFLKIQDLQALMGTVSYREDHTSIDEMVIAKMDGGVPKYLSSVKYR